MKQQSLPRTLSYPKLLLVFLSLITLFIFAPHFVAHCFAETTTLAWDANSEDNLAGYKIYYSTGSLDGPFNGTGLTQGVSPISVDLSAMGTPGSPSFQLSGLVAGETYYFTVSAYNDSGTESEFSNIVTYNVPLPVTYSITASASGQGIISPSGVVGVLEGSSKAFIISADENHHIADVVVDGISMGPIHAYSFENISSAHTIRAVFEIDAFSITASAGDNGIISPEGTASLNAGNNQSYVIKPNENYHITDVIVDGTSVGPVDAYVFTDINTGHTIHAVFEIDTFLITSSIMGNGTITPDGTLEVTYGSNQTYLFTPDTSYQIADLIIDGRSIGAVTEYAFTNIKGNHSIEASFTEVATEFSLEAGEVIADTKWQQVNFTRKFVHPVVVASAISSNDSEPAIVRIDNITANGFEISVQEWDYLDDDHLSETIGYMVMESGSFTLVDGSVVEAGTFATEGIYGFSDFSYTAEFKKTPVVIASIASYNDPDAAVVRLQNVSATQFEYQVQEQEAYKYGHTSEIVSYIAWEPCRTSIDDVEIEVGRTQDDITHKSTAIAFSESFSAQPVFLAAMQTRDGGDTASLRWSDITNADIMVKVEEEQSKDSEIGHTSEIVGYIALASAAPSDIDMDGLSDEEENAVYGTDPYAQDTDEDGITDMEEIIYWGTEWNADPDSDGIINLLDRDADNDGVWDGSELENGTNPSVADNQADEPEIIPYALLSIHSVDSEELTAENGAAENAIDGRSDTFWHTEWYLEDPACPHEIVIDMGNLYKVSGLQYLPRQQGVNGTIGSYEISVSYDAMTWNPPIVQGTFTADISLKELAFEETTGRYVRIRALSEINGKPWTSAAEINIIGRQVTTSTILPNTLLSIYSVDSEELTAEDGAAENAIDGLSDTFWHTEWYLRSPAYPHEIVIDLGDFYRVCGIKYLPRQDGSQNGTVGNYEIYVSSDAATWGNPISKGTFDSDKSLKEIAFSEKTGQFVKFKALSEINGNPWTSAAEINIIAR